MQSQKQWEGKLQQSCFLHFREGVKNLFMESVASSNHLHESLVVESKHLKGRSGPRVGWTQCYIEETTPLATNLKLRKHMETS